MTAAQEPLPCPFCGSNPHRGPTKVEIGQDGEPMQHYRIWCPKLHAGITELNEQRAIAAWNTRAAIAAVKASCQRELRIVFDGPPSHESGRFVEVEDEAGKSVNAGEWHRRPDGLYELRIEAWAAERLSKESSK